VSGTFNYPRGVAITPDGLKAYVANEGAGTVSVINVSNDTAYKTITVGTDPRGVTISPDGAYLYVTNNGANTVSKIYIANDTVVSTISGFNAPMSVGNAMRQTRLPTANIIQNVTSGTVPFAVLFNGSTTAGTPTAFSWNFGDGNTSTIRNTTHTYTTAGTYTVTFNASNIAGYSVDTETNLITANAAGSAPVANFTANVTTGTSPKAILFTDSSTNTPTSWQWNFGDGTSNATTQNPTHTYTSAGTYTVTLTATNAAGSGVKTRSGYITISDVTAIDGFSSSQFGAMIQMQCANENSNITPQWNYAENIGDDRGITFGFIGFTTGTYDGNILIKYYTTLNASNSLASYIPALDAIDAGPHTYNDGDSNPSTTGLTGFIEAVQNCNDPLFRQAQIHEMDSMYWDPAYSDFETIGARNAVTMAIIYDATIRFGEDGAQSFITSTNSYLGGTPGTGVNENMWDERFLTYFLAAINNDGASEDQDRINSWNAIIDSGNVNLTVPFAYEVYGDNFIIDGNIGLILSDTPQAPIADFTASPTSGIVPETITFTDASTGSNITSWAWSFGDGTSNSTSQNPTHTYDSVGTYTVTLTVTNDVGSAVKTRTNYISITPEPVTPCVSSFTANPTSGTLPLVVTFTDTSTNTPTSWQWNFGDGTSNSSSRNPVHIYNNAGTYTVMLTATNTGGGNTKTETNYIVVSPVNSIIANFSANRTSGIIPQQVQFTDASAGATSWDWNFGDGTTSTSQNPLHTYTYATTYTVTLNVSDGASSDSEIKSGYITISPSGGGDSGVLAHFTYGAVSTAAQFSDASLGSPESWEWNFGDGNTSIEQNPVHEFSTPGTYLVTLSVTKGGITSYYSYPVTVNVGAPNNYSQYYQNFFIPGMGGWDFVSHTEDFWTTVTPSALFWAIIILIPYLTIYNRTGTIIIPAVLYLFTGGILAMVMPPFLGQFYYWFIILGSAGVIYRLFVGE
jgi:YVTN family beta-propeller protein